MVELMFVNVSHPTQLGNSKARTKVRSHISKLQHERKRNAIERAVEELSAEERMKDDVRTSRTNNETLDVSGDALLSAPEATFESPTAQLDLARVGSAFYFTTCQSGLSITSGSNPSLLEPFSCFPAGDAAVPPRGYDEHTDTPSTTSSTRGGCDVPNGRQYCEQGEDISSWEQVPGDHEEHDYTSIFTTTTESISSHHDAQLTYYANEYAPSPRASVNLHDPSDELQPFAKKLGLSITAILDHFHKVSGAVASAREPEYALPQGYIHSMYYASMRVEPATRAAVVLATAAGIRLLQRTPSPPALLSSLRGYALGCLRSALEDPERCTSDAVITAVLNMAVFEQLYGRSLDHEVHMRGLVRIRGLRGATMDQCLARMLACMFNVTQMQISDWTSVAYR